MKGFLTGVGLCCLIAGLVRIYQLQQLPPASPVSEVISADAKLPADNLQPQAQEEAGETSPSVETPRRDPRTAVATQRAPRELAPRPREWREQPVQFLVNRDESRQPQFDP